MKYKMNVRLTTTDNEREREVKLELECAYSYDPDTYGNGYYLYIGKKNRDGFETLLDLRYSKEFNRNKKISYLAQWAENYWCGENGAYLLEEIEIKREGEHS